MAYVLQPFGSFHIHVIAQNYHSIYLCMARGGIVVKALRYKPQVTGSIPDDIIEFFQ